MEPLEIDEPAPAGRWPVERGLGSLARVALALLCAVVTVSVITRALWQNIVPDDVLLVSELMVAVILAPLALVTARDEHISVSVFTRRAGAGARRLLAVLGHIAGICFFAVLAWAYFTMFSDSWQTGEYYEGILGIPHWGSQLFAALAVSVVVARLALMLFRDLFRATGRT